MTEISSDKKLDEEHVGVAIGQALLGIDPGDKRVGVAVKPADEIICQPVGILPNAKSIFSAIKKLAADHNCETIVVGLPRDINGNDTAQTTKARAFAGELSDKTDLHIIMYDEFMTTQRARENLTGKGNAKTKVDADAAAILLHDYLGSMV